MSFDELKAVDVTAKVKDIEIAVGEKTLRFKAKEISILQRMHIAQAQKNGGDPFVQLIVYSIVDEDGKHMTHAQASALADAHAVIFFAAAAEINGYTRPEGEKAEEVDPAKN